VTATTTTPAPAADSFAGAIASPPAGSPRSADAPPGTSSGAMTSPSAVRTPAGAADLAADLDLLRQVHAALHGGRADVALSLLDHEGKGLDAGPLAEEAQGARVAALCQLGRLPEARAAFNRAKRKERARAFGALFDWKISVAGFHRRALAPRRGCPWPELRPPGDS